MCVCCVCCVWLEPLGWLFPNTLGHILEAHVTNCPSTCIACSFLEYAWYSIGWSLFFSCCQDLFPLISFSCAHADKSNSFFVRLRGVYVMGQQLKVMRRQLPAFVLISCLCMYTPQIGSHFNHFHFPFPFSRYFFLVF